MHLEAEAHGPGGQDPYAAALDETKKVCFRIQANRLTT